MDYQEINAATIDRWVEEGWEWGVPLDHESFERAKRGEWDMLLTPTKAVPHDWFGGSLRGKGVGDIRKGVYGHFVLVKGLLFVVGQGVDGGGGVGNDLLRIRAVAFLGHSFHGGFLLCFVSLKGGLVGGQLRVGGSLFGNCVRHVGNKGVQSSLVFVKSLALVIGETFDLRLCKSDDALNGFAVTLLKESIHG